jgi:hypothetical protein
MPAEGSANSLNLTQFKHIPHSEFISLQAWILFQTLNQRLETNHIQHTTKSQLLTQAAFTPFTNHQQKHTKAACKCLQAA